jgi:DNA-binding response OmpR family regulator
MQILLLENDRRVMAVLRSGLQRIGHSISQATTAAQALEACSVLNKHFDLLITAVNLPVSSGLDVALQLKAWMPSLKILLTSGLPLGYLNHQHIAQFNELPSDSVLFMEKPFRLADLRSTVDLLMRPRPEYHTLVAIA